MVGGTLTLRLCQLAVLGAAGLGALGPGLVGTLVVVVLRQAGLGVDALDQTPPDASPAGH